MLSDGWKEEFEGKKILIWGFGREGRSSYSLIRKVLPEQWIDICEPRKNEAALLKAVEETTHTKAVFEEDAAFDRYDMILKSPGIVIPEGMSKDNITQESELFLKHYRNQVIGITGTKGKSTTTSLMYAILGKKFPMHLIGNIGIPCFDCIENLAPEDLCAFEISCHQLEYGKYSPHVAVFLNLYEEHLDHYGSFKAYGDAKANIFRNQEKQDLTIINASLQEYVKEIEHPILIGKDIYNNGRTLVTPEGTITVDNCKLIGSHNYLNLAIVYEVAKHYGISDADFLQACSEFEPLHHRLENIGTKDGITYVNDSISTIGPSCIMALEALDQVDSVLVGGMDRGIEYDELEDYLSVHKELHVIFMYATGKRIFEEMKNKNLAHENMAYVENLTEAVSMAKKVTRPGHICLLSPAASSYDHFKNFEERGAVFERLALEK